MNDAAAELLRTRPRNGANPDVFPGERGIGPRGLRHIFASHLASSGEVDLYTLQKLMTRKSPTMTQRYAHLTDAALKRGSDVMGRIVEQATAEQANGEKAEGEGL